MSFHQFSDDIILDIIDCIRPDSSWSVKPLCKLARSSRRLNQLATPLIYKDIDMGSWDQEALLVKTLLRNPKLGYHLPHFAITTPHASNLNHIKRNPHII